MFDATHGFGGDGAPGTYALPSENPPADYHINPISFRGCVVDGPFAHHKVPLGPGKYIGDHCLTRGIQEAMKTYLNSTAVEVIAALRTYGDFHVEIEGMPLTTSHRLHDGGHFMIGGDMSNLYSSPGGELDPIFHSVMFADCNVRPRPPVLPTPREPRSHLVALAKCCAVPAV